MALSWDGKVAAASPKFWYVLKNRMAQRARSWARGLAAADARERHRGGVTVSARWGTGFGR